MAGHWFDRLARRHAAAPGEAPSGAGLTRRAALGRAGGGALALTALGALGSTEPARGAPDPRRPAPPRRRYGVNDLAPAVCNDCVRQAKRTHDNSRRFLGKGARAIAAAGPLVPATGLFLLAVAAAAIANEAAYGGDLAGCSGSVCDAQAMHPAPITHPVDDPGSDEPPLCPPGTHGCPIGPNGGYCCYGTDVCCGGICCIIEVGCACTGLTVTTGSGR